MAATPDQADSKSEHHLRGRLRAVLLLATMLALLAAGLPQTPVAAVPPPLPPAVGTLKTLVIRVYWTQTDATSTQDLERRVFGEVSDWYAKSSYGLLKVTGDVVPTWLRITAPNTTACWDPSNAEVIMSRAKQAALQAGYDPTKYARRIVYFPRSNCGDDQPSAWADQPGSDLWLDGYDDVATIVHELGHTFGLSHSVRAQCTDPGTGQRVVLSARANCGDLPENWFDVMGNAGDPWSYSAPVKDRIGWLGGHEVAITPGSTVTIKPLETASDTNAAYLRTPSGREYWLEFRQRTAMDSTFLEPVTHGVLINLVDDGYNVAPVLLDMHPATDDMVDAALDAGQSWTTPDGFTFAVTKVTPAGATVKVTARPPSAPTRVSVSRNDRARTGSIRWSPPSTAGALPITGYRVTRDGTSTKDTGPSSVLVPATTRSHTFTDLAPGRGYLLSVRAVTRGGDGPAVALHIPMAVALPGRPGISRPRAGLRNDGVVSVTGRWRAPVGGGPITSYVVTATDRKTGKRTTAVAPASTRARRITGLVNHHHYTISVTARNSRGAGLPSASSRKVLAR